ncbi:hypothetical protein [Novosphingobium sp.]|uniref:hypothetical protein n=1 Tax=Novosphingobium sp. TaxID=1874826 RepID=UPI0028AC1BBE|nr:hypothetical protein [Novosphingobium sp.]
MGKIGYMAIGGAVLVAGFVGLAQAKAPTGLADLIGVRGSSLENELSNRGFEFARSQGAQFWWNASTRTCASVSIGNGRVARIDTATPQQCGKSGGGQASQGFDCNAPDVSEADRYRCQPGAGARPQTGGRAAAVKACQDAFGPNGKLGTISALRPGFWEVILSDNYGRKVSCTGRAEGQVEQWDELGRH